MLYLKKFWLPTARGESRVLQYNGKPAVKRAAIYGLDCVPVTVRP